MTSYLVYSTTALKWSRKIQRGSSCSQRRSQTFSFGGGTGGASFATRGAVSGLCRTFRKIPEKFWGDHWRGQAKFGGQCPPWHPPSSAPACSLRESIFLHVWYGNAVPTPLFLAIHPARQQQFFFSSPRNQTFFIDQYSPVSNNFFSTYCTVFLIVAFRTKNWMDEKLIIDSLQTSRFPLWRGKILSDHFQCPCDAINTFQGNVPA